MYAGPLSKSSNAVEALGGKMLTSVSRKNRIDLE